MEDKIYWLWLTLKKGITPNQQKELLQEYKTAEAIYNTEDYGEGVKDKIEEKLKDKSLDEAERVCNKIEMLGGYIVTIDDAEYPPLLRNLHHPPYVLYMRGKQPNWREQLTIAVVGTRTCSHYGQRATENITKALSENGVVIVSGMARGIDGIAARTAIKNGGMTIAVLGSGLDVIYPSENRMLYDEISEKGLIITEYPPGTRPLRENFPRRNRIIAGLSYGVIVAQAPKKSGALITASYAIENGRDVFVIPADIFETGFEGSNELLRQGAKVIVNAQDVLCEYPYIDFEQNVQPNTLSAIDRIDMSLLNETECEIVKLIGDNRMHIDDIARTIGKTSGEVNASMIMLEINGIVKKETGNIYYL